MQLKLTARTYEFFRVKPIAPPARSPSAHADSPTPFWLRCLEALAAIDAATAASADLSTLVPRPTARAGGADPR